MSKLSSQVLVGFVKYPLEPVRKRSRNIPLAGNKHTPERRIRETWISDFLLPLPIRPREAGRRNTSMATYLQYSCGLSVRSCNYFALFRGNSLGCSIDLCLLHQCAQDCPVGPYYQNEYIYTYHIDSANASITLVAWLPSAVTSRLTSFQCFLAFR